MARRRLASRKGEKVEGKKKKVNAVSQILLHLLQLVSIHLIIKALYNFNFPSHYHRILQRGCF